MLDIQYKYKTTDSGRLKVTAIVDRRFTFSLRIDESFYCPLVKLANRGKLQYCDRLKSQIYSRLEEIKRSCRTLEQFKKTDQWVLIDDLYSF